MLKLPPKRSSSWMLRWMPAYGLVLAVLLWLNRFVALGQTVDVGVALRFVLLSFILSVVVNGFGWLGARWVWTITSLGIVFGLVVMFVYVSRDMAGWEDLASFLAFAESIVIGFALGLAAEGCYRLLNRRKKK
ncbi:hypothetical protein FE783_04135 [Paenibacillus mesophilus]|uniref:hypothetical protein n=1 Tax=Paenibacillus mesophilus TaxID=2582849 RepID=UPI00110EB904|nr:hypothetical protein [Paenibacillus mesophilus]TMV52140.1 hypothetical protein FE783_04135 [Paenibacillus mesophilus]